MLRHALNSPFWLCESSLHHMITRPRRYEDVACWVIKVSLEWSLGLVLDPQGSRAARFPQLWRAVLMICNLLSDWPKALIRISIPAAPGAWVGPAYSHSRVARIQLVDLIKVSTCVWLAPATLREEGIIKIYASTSPLIFLSYSSSFVVEQVQSLR